MSPTSAPPGRQSEVRSAAQGGVVTLAGSGLSAVLGFVLNLMFARELGAHGAGIVLQSIAVFTIALSFGKLGLDTTAVWCLPRFLLGDRAKVKPAIIGLLVPAVLTSLLVDLVWFGLVALPGVHIFSHEMHDALLLSAIFLPAAVVMTVALASTRAFGGVVPFNLIGNILVPVVRPLGLLVVVAMGGAATAATFSWALPWLFGAVAAMVVVIRQVTRREDLQALPWRRDRAVDREIFRYSLPRSVMAGLEQAILWLDVILVGSILGATQSGIYGSAARFVSAGMIVLTALRIVVAPRFSAMLAERDLDALSHLYLVTTRWIVLFGSPVYLTLALFSPTVLAWFGPGFGRGAHSMTILCLGSVATLAAGNVQSLLLMSGRIGWGVTNKLVVLVFNLGLNLWLIPRVGITGAAVSWALSMVLDTALAAIQVRRATGLTLAPGATAHSLAAVCLCVLVPSGAVLLTLGQGNVQLLLAIIVSGVLLLAYCAVDRHRLELVDLAMLRRGSRQD
ncbi:MAG TPA: oligosaccharide flippase family protein [Nocardioides sp.]|uniref:oligosaccharide flippase family protein n=1 Tax=Nocardioides sp. TaxID=35761 RepID=UPI002E2FCD97|nr:oligosaccharide flippase family protein [Nocardioides sp.]HEX3931519.1 oligosaccharide flippase family protein [Nocardioides sp.]